MKINELRQIIKEELSKINLNESQRGRFNAIMYNMEYDLKKNNPREWKKFEQESGEYWEEIGAENWGEAFSLDPMGCEAWKERLESLI